MATHDLGVEGWVSRAGPDYNDSKEPTVHEEHMEAEITALRVKLGERTFSSPGQVLQHDLDILQTMKRDFVDMMISRGISYETAGNISRVMNFMLADVKAKIT
jgi:hypothetical protein